MKNNRKTKGITVPFFREEGKLIKSVTYIIYNSKDGHLWFSHSIRCGNNSIKMGYTNGKGYVQQPFISESELKDKARNLMIENPFISSCQLKEKLKCSLYRISRIYTRLRREVLSERRNLIAKEQI